MASRLGSWFYSLTQFIITILTLALLFVGAIEVFHLLEYGGFVDPITWLWHGFRVYVLKHPFLNWL